LIKEAVDGVVDNLADHAPWPIPKQGENRGGLMPQIFPSEQLPPPWQGTAVLCVAGRGSLDEATAFTAGAAPAKTWHWCARGAV